MSARRRALEEALSEVAAQRSGSGAVYDTAVWDCEQAVRRLLAADLDGAWGQEVPVHLPPEYQRGYVEGQKDGRRQALEEARDLARERVKFYPEDVFSPLVVGETSSLRFGLVDRISASMARHTANRIAEDLEEILRAELEVVVWAPPPGGEGR